MYLYTFLLTLRSEKEELCQKAEYKSYLTTT